jgi:hypothetical protein
MSEAEWIALGLGVLFFIAVAVFGWARSRR